MGEASDMPTSRVQRSLAFVKSRPRGQKVTALGAVALLATAPFGGLKAVDDTVPAAKLELDKPFEVGPFEVTIDRVVWTEDLAPIAKPIDGQHRLLLVLGDVTNKDDGPAYWTPLRSGFFVSNSGVDEVDGAPALADLRFPDETSPSQFNPGVTYRLVWIFQQRKASAGTSITLNQRAVAHVVDGPIGLDDDYYRVDPEIARRAVLPVEELQ